MTQGQADLGHHQGVLRLQRLSGRLRGDADGCAVLDLNWDRWQADGTADPSVLTPLISTQPFDHCNFSVLNGFPQDEQDRWSTLLLSMSYDNPKHREMMDLEGLTAWLPGRTTGYRDLAEAVEETGFFSAGSAG